MPHRFQSSPKNTPLFDSAPIRATEADTTRYRQRFAGRFSEDFFRPTSFGVAVSSIGLGTYLGEISAADDQAYTLAAQHAVRSGINLIDTAINYRAQRSERAIGTALQQVFAAGDAGRAELVVCTKGGYIPLDESAPGTKEEYRAYVQREYVDSQILLPDEIVAGGHSIAPRFLRYCLAKSRQNLGLRTVDVYYLHNPEQQLRQFTREDFAARLRLAFAFLEEAAERAEVGVYGCATWDGLLAAPDTKSHLSLAELVGIARDVAGDAHHFRVIQLPMNLAMLDGVRTPTQLVNGRLLSVTDAAQELGLTVIGSAALMQAKLASGLPESFRAHFPALNTDAQRALAFARTLPGVTAALVGMKQREHVDENLHAGLVVPGS